MRPAPLTCSEAAPTRGGFTLIEALVASIITVLVISGALSTFIYGLRSWQAEAVKNEINIDLEGAMERIRQDLRLSSVGIGLMAFYPADAAEYIAISFPMSSVTNGLLARDASTGKIKWTQTVIYHVRSGNPDQLRRTVFTPRSTNATPNALYAQLQSVVQGNSTAACMAGESVSEQIVFQNLVNLRIRPPEIRFDGYAPSYCKAETVNWGSVVLSGGVHNLKFTVVGRNTNNTTGYKIGIDKFSLSPSASPREGEIYLPANSHPFYWGSPYYSYSLSGGSVAAEDMSSNGASWSGNCQLTYNAAAVSNGITFAVENDLLCDANFDNPSGNLFSNVSRKIDRSFTNSWPYIPDIVISMDTGINWTATECTASNLPSIDISAEPVVNVIYGGTNAAAAITRNGEWVRVQFTAGAGTKQLHIESAWIARQSSGTNPVPGTISNLAFSGKTMANIPAGSSIWSDWVPNYAINRDDNYLVQFELKTGLATSNNAAAWINTTVPAMSYVGGTPNNRIIAVSALEVRYPSYGLYRSGIFDTQIDNPVYQRLNWTEFDPGLEGDIDIRVRSGSNPDLSDAGAWLPIGYCQGNTDNNITSLPSKRYVQYEALFRASGSHTNASVLRDVTINWEAPQGLVDLQVDFAKGPDYGIISATVDGQTFAKGLEIEMEIFKLGPFGTNTAMGVMEIRPLNTNK